MGKIRIKNLEFIIKNLLVNIDEGDLRFQVKDSILNLRVLLLIESPNGYIFEHHEDGYYFAIGGRMKFNETSHDSAERELLEELSIDEIDLKFIGIIENFFNIKEQKYHEINFIYKGSINDDLDLKNFHSDHMGYKYIKLDNANKFDIKPKAILKILRTKMDFYHLVQKEK